MTQRLRTHMIFPSPKVQFPALISGSSQPLLIPVPGDPMPSGFCGYMYPQRAHKFIQTKHAHKCKIKFKNAIFLVRKGKTFIGKLN